MNWFSRLFRNKPVDNKSVNPPLTTGEQEISEHQPLGRIERNLSVDQLRQFIPLRDLDESMLLTLPHATLKYAKDMLLFEVNQRCESIYYLLKGTVHVQPVGEYGYLIGENTVRARLPLNTGRFFGATAQAVTDVRLLEVPAEFNSLWLENTADDGYIQLNDIQLPDDIANKVFFDRCVQAYRNNTLQVPSLPDVAIRLNKSMQHDLDIKVIGEIIHFDPRIVTKLIQVANSPIYATATPVGNCQDAVSRLGLNATRNLVLSLCMKELFHCSNAELMQGMRQLWKNCVYLASLCFVLAQESGEVPPEDAMLAGLVADIGAMPLMQLASQTGEAAASFEQIQLALPHFRAPVGARVLRNLEFPQALCNIPQLADNWLYDSGPQLTVDDIVILAKLHSYFGSGKALELPYINSIPAYSKLRDGALGPDFSLAVLRNAQTRIRAAMQLLS